MGHYRHDGVRCSWHSRIWMCSEKRAFSFEPYTNPGQGVWQHPWCLESLWSVLRLPRGRRKSLALGSSYQSSNPFSHLSCLKLIVQKASLLSCWPTNFFGTGFNRPRMPAGRNVFQLEVNFAIQMFLVCGPLWSWASCLSSPRLGLLTC